MAPRQRNVDPQTTSSNGPEISEEEQWRIIQETGLLRQLSQSNRHDEQAEHDEDEENPFADELFNAILLIIPFSFLLMMMEILIHQQYGRKASVKDVFDRLASGVPIMSIFIFYTNRYKSHRRMRFLTFLVSLLVGPRLIYLVNEGSWIANMKQCPPLATIWIYTVVQLDLGPAVMSLVIIGVWFWWSGFKLAFH